MNELKKVIDTLDEAADSFDGIATREQKKIYDEVITLAKDLDTDALGRVRQSIANLKRLTEIKAKLAALSKDKEWVAGIGKFLQYFGTLQKEQNAYFSANFPSATLSKSAKEKNELMRQLAIQNTIDGLMGDGLKANVTDKLNDILLRAVTTNAKFADLQEELRAHLMGQNGGQGAFARYATTYATTALSQFTGQNNKLLTDDLDTEWFMYTGSNNETTREFCEQLTKKKYIHKSEIPTILTGRIDEYQCAIYEKTGLPIGMIAGTTPENFQCNCGGWNCRHQLVPVADAVVPKQIRDRLRLNQKIEKAKKLSEEPKKVLYSSFIPFAPVIIEKLQKIQRHRAQQKLYQEIIDDEAFDLQFRAGEHKTVVHPQHKGKHADYWQETLGMARDVNLNGSDVAFLPEEGNKKSADAITKIFGDYTIAEFKYSHTDNWDTISHAIRDANKQGKAIVIKMTEATRDTFVQAIEYNVRNNHKMGDIKVINEYGKEKDIHARDLYNGKYKKIIRGLLR